MKSIRLTGLLTLMAFLCFSRDPLLLPAETSQPSTSLIFPIPQELERLSMPFQLNPKVEILIPERPSEEELFLARILAADLTDRHRFPIGIKTASKLPDSGQFVLLGAISNPLVRRLVERLNLRVTALDPGPEGYVLQVDERFALVAGSDEAGAFYGLQSLRQLLKKSEKGVYLPGVRIRDWPYKPFRGIKLFLPGRDHIPFFKRFVRDFMALYKYNKLILEMNAGMRLERHPELNEGWMEFARDLNYSRRDRPLGPGAQYQNSAHHDTADGGVLEKDEVAELVSYAQKHHIEVVPELPSLTHSYYLLTRHRDLAEIQAAEWPDTYCPLNPKSYELFFDVMDEYLEAMAPRMVHIGHDEWRMPVDVCPRCKDQDKGELFLQDVIKIHGYLKDRGVKTALWGDHLVEAVRGSSPVTKTSPAGYVYQIPEAVSPEQIRQSFPKDILVFNWFWDDRAGSGREGWGESNDLQLERMGFQQTYGNLTPLIQNWGRRSSRPSIAGGAPSCWAATTEFSLGKDRIWEFLGCANLLWSKHELRLPQLSNLVSARMAEVRRSLRGKNLPSEDDNEVVPLSIREYFNLPAQEQFFGVDLSEVGAGPLTSGRKNFHLERPRSPSLQPAVLVGGKVDINAANPETLIKIEEEAVSLLFLHACARPALNDWVDRYVYNLEDTADLLGWYEVVYEDGLVASVPIRYRVNILEWNWNPQENQGNYCYGADLVYCSKNGDRPVTLFAFEWPNARPGKVIAGIRLKASRQFRNTKNEVIPENGVLLAALSVVRRRVPPPVRLPSQYVPEQD